jgi:hypothetical protein
LFFGLKHCFFVKDTILAAQTLFWRFQHCFFGSNRIWVAQTLFFGKKQCLKAWDGKTGWAGTRYGKKHRESFLPLDRPGGLPGNREILRVTGIWDRAGRFRPRERKEALSRPSKSTCGPTGARRRP